MSYVGELRTNFRPLAAASLGLGCSVPFLTYANSIFAPHLIEAFHWSRAQFALYGLIAVGTVVVLPIAGRLTDRFGVRPVAAVGIFLMPLVFLAYSQMQGSFVLYLLLSTLKLGVGHLTSAVVYTRLIAEYFDRARGLALTIVVSTPAALGALSVPLIEWSIDQYGWRGTYVALAVYVLVLGLITLVLIPKDVDRSKQGGATEQKEQARPNTFGQDFALITRSPIFWTIIGGMFLCMLAIPLHGSQLNILLGDNGLSTSTGALVVSLYAASTIVGRIACGLALDRFSTPIVTSICMMPPAIGLFILATDYDTLYAIAFAMMLFGFSVGAENDLISFLIARYFKLRIFSSTSSLLMSCGLIASSTGAVAISATLSSAGTYAPYLYFVSATTFVGSLLFLLLPKSREIPKVG